MGATRTARPLIATLALGLTLLSAPTAVAAPADDAHYLARFVELAETYWGQRPAACAGGVTAQVGPTNTGGEGEWRSREPCTVWVAPTAAANLTGVGASYWCHVVVHEYGHALGYGHTDDPAGVMFSETPTGDQIVEPCRQRSRCIRAARSKRSCRGSVGGFPVGRWREVRVRGRWYALPR